MDYSKIPVKDIKGVGPKTEKKLNRMGIFTAMDLLTHFPREYEDRESIKPLSILKHGECALVYGQVTMINKDKYTSSGKHITNIVFKNETGFFSGVWYNQRYIKNNFKVGKEYVLYGKVSKYYNQIQIICPEYEKYTENYNSGILPVYPLTKNLSLKVLRSIVETFIKSEEFEMDEILPDEIKERFRLYDIDKAIKNIHFPESNKAILEAEKRVKFDELLILQLGIEMQKERMNNNKGIKFETSKELASFFSSLPYELTKAQKRTVNDVLNDMKSEKPMNRLIQGDVGSGKTIIAAAALFNGVKNGYQGVMMAPTEILAQQHYEFMKGVFNNFDINIGFISGSMPKKEKDKLKSEISSGEVDVIIGTHAIIQDDVVFNNLGIVITDEQHRFGVRQRALLGSKGENVDVLVMTATPIPRTMALFIYGDLDISIIDELPPGRQKIDTFAVKPQMRKRVYNFLKDEVRKGRQGYIVCPIIDESDTIEAQSAVALFKRLQRENLDGINVGLLHGKMKQKEKDDIMLKFKEGKIDVLVSTTVIEVGIDVPNATIVIIENADRFGLAQLHQLRGRVGRGEHKSYCILISNIGSDVAKKRMEAMTQISDGFKIAEVDLKIRGTGELFGLRQHGLPELKLADLFRDEDILIETNTLAKELVQKGNINEHEYDKLRDMVKYKFDQNIDDITFN